MGYIPRHWRPSMDFEEEAAPEKSQDEGSSGSFCFQREISRDLSQTHPEI